MKISLGYNQASLFGRYLLKRHVGYGTGSIVWEAYDVEKEEEVALKEIRRDDPRFRKLVERIEAEFTVNQAVHQRPGTGTKNILKIHGILTSTPFWAFWRPKGKVLIMDLLKGVDIRTHAKENGMTFHNAMVLYFTIAKALQQMHACGYVHCDLNPKNIMLHYRNPFLIDFGLSQPVGRELYGGKIGQNRYMAPEQYLGGVLTGKTDGCALARLVYELLHGKLLDQVINQKDEKGRITDRKVVNPPPGSKELLLETRLKKLFPKMPADVDEMMYTSMLPDPDKRPDLDTVVSVLLAHLKKGAKGAPTNIRALQET